MARTGQGLLALAALSALLIPNANAQTTTPPPGTTPPGTTPPGSTPPGTNITFTGDACGSIIDVSGATQLTFGSSATVGPLECSWTIWDSTGATQSISATFPGSPEEPTDMHLKVSYCFDTSCIAPIFLGYAVKSEAVTAPPGAVLFIELMVADGVPIDYGSYPIALGAPTCSYTISDACVQKYTQLNGCFRDIFLLPQGDECYSAVTGGQCVKAECDACDCNLPPAILAGSPHCMAKCGYQYPVPTDFCAPGCRVSMINDTVCQAECYNLACLHDGADCAANPIEGAGRIFMSADVDMNGELDQFEISALTSNYGLTLAAAPPGSVFADPIALGFALFPPAMLDDKLDSPAMLDTLMLRRAKDLIILADANLDGMVDRAEASAAIGFEMTVDDPLFITVSTGGVLMPPGSTDMGPGMISADALGHTLYGIITSLAGRNSEPPFDHKGASAAVVKMLATSEKGISMMDSKILGFSAELFMALDGDNDGGISEKELLDAQVSAVTGACSGTTITTDREQMLKTKPPLAGSVSRSCAFLVLPTWHYPTPMVAANPSGRRRLLSVNQEEAKPKHSFVMTRKGGHAPNHLHADSVPMKHKPAAIRAMEERKAASAKSASTRRSLGGRRALVSDDFVVSVQNWDSMAGAYVHHCAGALFRADSVLVPVACSGYLNASPQVVLMDGTAIPIGGMKHHPTPDSVGVVVLTLTTDAPATMVPAVLHDGGGLDITECGEPMLTVGFAPGKPNANMPSNFTSEGTWYPGPARHAPTVTLELDVCTQSMAMSHRIIPVSEANVCVNASGPGACLGGGSLIVVHHPEDPAVLILVGFQNEDCMAAQKPQLFTRVASALPWILSIEGMGVFPPLKLTARVDSLTIPAGVDLKFYSGSWVMPEYEVGLVNSTCDVGGTYYDDMALGSMVIELTSMMPASHVTSAVHIDISPSECGATPMGVGSSVDMSECEALSGCMWDTRDFVCRAPMCEFGQTWVNITRTLQKNGRAYTGGLGKDADVTPFVEYRQWMCARDWSVEEQLVCGVGPRELACFRFDEKAEMFSFMGRNEDVKIVSTRRFDEGVIKERMGMTTF